MKAANTKEQTSQEHGSLSSQRGTDDVEAAACRLERR